MISSFPTHTRLALSEFGTEGLSGVVADGVECAGARFHSPIPRLLHEVEVGGEAVMLCGTCRDNLSVLTHLISVSDGELAWTVRREFGNDLRALASKRGT